MSKRLRGTIVALVVIVALVAFIVSFLSIFRNRIPEREAPGLPLYFGEQRLDIDMPEEDAEEQDLVEFVAELYEIACENYKQADKAAFEVIYTTYMKIGGDLMSLPVPGTRYCLKEGAKRYYMDFAIPDQSNPLLGTLLNAFAAESSWYGEAQYTDETMDYTVSRKIYSGSGESGNGVGPKYAEDGTIVADWSNVTTKELAKPVYAAYQEGDFHHTDHEVSVDTIIPGTVSVEYNSEGRYYICNFELDPEKVPEALLESLRNSSGQPSARYTKLVQSMTIWDSGYFRTYHALDDWTTDVAMSSTLDFQTTYYFDTVGDAEKFDINNYQYMAEMCHK